MATGRIVTRILRESSVGIPLGVAACVPVLWAIEGPLDGDNDSAARALIVLAVVMAFWLGALVLDLATAGRRVAAHGVGSGSGSGRVSADVRRVAGRTR